MLHQDTDVADGLGRRYLEIDGHCQTVGDVVSGPKSAIPSPARQRPLNEAREMPKSVD